VWQPSGATLASADERQDTATLTPAAAHGSVAFTLSDGNPAPGWLDGLRGIGGMTIPVAGGLLNGLTNLLPFAVLWWSLDQTVRRFPGVPVRSAVPVRQQATGQMTAAPPTNRPSGPAVTQSDRCSVPRPAGY
jgi:hypothetical protein